MCIFSVFKTPLQFFEFLLEQKRGPVQYLITCTFSIFDPTFSSEIALRLPFTIANLMALACFFVLVYRLFTLEVAIYSSFLFATNGLFIAFARIVQYQSFVILAAAAGLLGLTLALKYEKWRVLGLYLGFASAAMGLFAHFDAAFMMPPMAVLVVHWWKKFHDMPDFAYIRRHLIAAIALFAFPVLVYYIAYFMGLGSDQTTYWEKRAIGESTNLMRLFQFYNPGPVLWIYLGSVVIGLTRIRKSIGWQVILSWFLPPFIFMVLIFKDSRTHAYTFLLPLLIIAGIGIDTLIGWLRTLLRHESARIVHAIVLAVFLMFAYLSYSIFIDHDPEYPWYHKRVLGIELEESGTYLAGTFGFPYNRKWRDIASWFDRLPDQTVFLTTNEKRSIARFYLPSKVQGQYLFAESAEQIQTSSGLYVLIIQAPQSWIKKPWGLRLDKWPKNSVPLHDFFNEDGELVATIYFLTQEQIDTEFR
jgi:4-amino-4-deoxy-L-arabinose transferase-like glycosyltransferase